MSDTLKPYAIRIRASEAVAFKQAQEAHHGDGSLSSWARGCLEMVEDDPQRMHDITTRFAPTGVPKVSTKSHPGHSLIGVARICMRIDTMSVLRSVARTIGRKETLVIRAILSEAARDGWDIPYKDADTAKTAGPTATISIPAAILDKLGERIGVTNLKADVTTILDAALIKLAMASSPSLPPDQVLASLARYQRMTYVTSTRFFGVMPNEGMDPLPRKAMVPFSYKLNTRATIVMGRHSLGASAPVNDLLSWTATAAIIEALATPKPAQPKDQKP